MWKQNILLRFRIPMNLIEENYSLSPSSLFLFASSSEDRMSETPEFTPDSSLNHNRNLLLGFVQKKFFLSLAGPKELSKEDDFPLRETKNHHQIQIGSGQQIHQMIVALVHHRVVY